MATSSVLGSIVSAVGNLSTDAAAWYSGLSGKPIIVSPASIGLSAAQQQANSQAALLSANPGLAGILGNPTILIVIGLGFLLLLFFILYRK